VALAETPETSCDVRLIRAGVGNAQHLLGCQPKVSIAEGFGSLWRCGLCVQARHPQIVDRLADRLIRTSI